MLPLHFLFFDFALSFPTRTARKVWVCIPYRLTVECALYPLILTMSLWHILHILQLRKVGCTYLCMAPQLKWPSGAVNPCPNQTRALELPVWLPLCSVSALLPWSSYAFPDPFSLSWCLSSLDASITVQPYLTSLLIGDSVLYSEALRSQDQHLIPDWLLLF